MQRNHIVNQMTSTGQQHSSIDMNDINHETADGGSLIRTSISNQLQNTQNNQANNIAHRVLVSAHPNLNGQLQIVQHGDRLIAMRTINGQEVKSDPNHESESDVVDNSISTLVSEVIVSSSMMNRSIVGIGGHSHSVTPVTSAVGVSSSGVIVTNAAAVNIHNSSELDEQLIQLDSDGNGNYSQIHQNPHGIPSQHNQLNQHQHLSSLHHGDGINSGASTSQGSPPLVGAGGGLILPSAQPAVNQYCAICKDRATGKHYGAASCDGCKGFFRRSVRKNHSYSCRYGRNCVVDKDKRNQCRYCRLRKCFKAGMKREAVQNERDRISNRRPSYEDQSNNTGISLQTLLQADNRYIETEMDLLPMDDVEDSSQCIRIDNKRVATVSDIGRAMKGQVTALVDWVKNVPAILDLRMDDKVALVRAHSGDHLLLNLIRRSIQEKDCLLLSNHYMIHRTMGPSPITRVAARILDLVEAMRDNLVDATEFACLKAVIFLDPSVAGLTEKSKVQQLRHQVLINLEDYVCDRQYDGRGRYGELLMTVPVLHSITSQMIEMIQLARAQGQIDIDNLLEEMLLGGSGHYGDATSSSDQSPAAAAASKSSALYDFVARAFSQTNGHQMASNNQPLDPTVNQHATPGHYYYEDPSGLFLNPNAYVPILQGMNPTDHQQQQQHHMVQDLHLSQSHAHSLANIQHIIPQNESNVVTSSTSSTSSSPEGAGRILPDQQSQHANVVVRGPDGNELVVSSGNDAMQHSQNHQQRPMTDREAMQVLLQNQPPQLHAHARNNQQQRLQLQQRHHNSPDQRDNRETNETGNGQSFKTEVMDVERTYQ